MRLSIRVESNYIGRMSFSVKMRKRKHDLTMGNFDYVHWQLKIPQTLIRMIHSNKEIQLLCTCYEQSHFSGIE